MRLMRLSLRPAVLAFALGAATCAAALVTKDAHASISIAVTWDGLLSQATTAAVVTAEEQRAVWENDRIYTYTRVHVDRAVAGEVATGGEIWVRTMGGVVGKIGQLVDGEAVLTIGKPQLLFLEPGPTGTFEVTARAQGQFPVVADEAAHLRVIKSSGVGALVMPRRRNFVATIVLAGDKLHNRPMDEALRTIATDWARFHASK